jgi:hypothetical protein
LVPVRSIALAYFEEGEGEMRKRRSRAGTACHRMDESRAQSTAKGSAA